MDLLFVADTSGSMADNRVKVAEGLHAFVGQLPANVDYRIGMMLAHSSRSSHTGRLWTLPNQDRDPSTGYPYVLDSSRMSQQLIQTRLRTMMETARDQNEQGEMMTYSLLQALTPAKLAESRALGFFRSTAALAVVFISDENDLCTIYSSNAGELTQTRWTGMTEAELQIRTRDCSSGISATQVIDAIRGLQQDRPFIFGAIVNNTEPFLNRTGNDGYGWGMMEVIEQSRGLSLDIEAGNYITGLGQLGQLVTRKLELILSRRLEHSPADPASIQVFIDATRKDFSFVESAHEVHFMDAGGARSTVEINYCLKPASAGGGTGGGGTGGGIFIPGIGI